MFSASSEALDRNAPTNANQIRLQTSRIRQEHRPIRYQLPARLSFRQGQEAIKAIGSTIERISGITASISSAVEQQGAATQSIAEGVKAAAGGTLKVADNIEHVARNAHETGATSGLMLKSARELSEVSSYLRDEVEKFLDSVRAA